ncbi:MAG TPA: hypothetical protein VGL91_14455, partial [Acidobacteriota bacterium]
MQADSRRRIRSLTVAARISQLLTPRWVLLLSISGYVFSQPDPDMPVPAALPPIPRRLTLAESEALLLQRNLAIATSRYQIEAARAARLIASYKPNPLLTVGGEQIPFYSPLM